MLNQLSMVFGLVCCFVGAVILFGAISKSDEWVIAGAAILSLGLVVASLELKTWLKWRQYKKYPGGGDGKLASYHKWLQWPGSKEPKLLFQPGPQNRRRSQRVMLHVAVIIKSEMPEGKCEQARAFTVDVNAHGGLLECPFRRTVGQQITLVNPQTGKEVGCRVVRVHQPSESSFTTAFEFERQSTRFWPLTLVPEDWGVTEELANNSG